MQDRRFAPLLLAGLIACLPGALLPAVAGAAQGARVTAVAGTAQRGGQALEQLGGVPEDEPVETKEDGGCSLLLEEDALVEVCGNTQLSLRKRVPGGPRVLDVQKGNVRVSAEPRLGDERIEIHTPAAIATILGTVVFVSVDALGVTTITSEVSRVMVRSSEKPLAGSTLVDGGQQIVVKPGEIPPARATRIEPKALAALGGCLVDFHKTSLEADRDKSLAALLDDLAATDSASANLPEVAFVEPGAPGSDDQPFLLDDPTSGNEPYEAPEANEQVREQIAEMLDSPGGPGDDDDFEEPCGDIPGEQCGPF